MQNIIHTLKTLRTVSGNEQLSLLEREKNNKLLQKVLLYTYDSHRKYKIDESKYTKLANKPKGGFFLPTYKTLTESDWNKYKEILDDLCNKRAAKDEDILKVVDFIDSFLGEEKEFLLHVLFKDLRLNMNIKKFQKVWPSFCSEPQVQLAELYNNQIFNKGYYSRKFDGKRMYIMDGIAYSRSNKVCKSKPIQHILDQLKDIKDYVLDGEIVWLNENDKEDFQKVISLTSNDEYCDECKNLKFIIFDMIDKQSFKDKQIWISFEDEYHLMSQTFVGEEAENPISYWKAKLNYSNILIPLQTVYKEDLESSYLKNNWEGLMYRNAESCYEYKRSSNLLKIKKMEDAEFDIVNLEEGSGKNIGKLGTLNIKLEEDVVGVGSGFTDKQREDFWKNKELIESPEFKLNNKVKVKYFSKTQDQKGKNGLRFPVFLAFRNLNGEEWDNF